jgi:hypothetical protein
VNRRYGAAARRLGPPEGEATEVIVRTIFPWAQRELLADLVESSVLGELGKRVTSGRFVPIADIGRRN